MRSPAAIASRFASGLGLISAFQLACSPGTEPVTNPRDIRTDPNDVGFVSGKVLGLDGATTPGWVPATTPHDPVHWKVLSGRSLVMPGAGHPVSGVIVELGIIHFTSPSGADPNAPQAIVVPNPPPGHVPLGPGPASPPGRFEVIARATSDAAGVFRFPRAPRREMLMLRARPPAPYQDTYSTTPFWLANLPGRDINIVLRGGLSSPAR